MELDDVVETSDIEEQEQLLSLTPPRKSVLPIAVPRTPLDSPPRKRVKVSHTYTPSLTRRDFGALQLDPRRLSSPSILEEHSPPDDLLCNDADIEDELLLDIKEEELDLFSQRSSPDPLDSLSRPSKSPTSRRSPSSEPLSASQLFSDELNILGPAASSTPPPTGFSSPPPPLSTSSTSPGPFTDPIDEDNVAMVLDPPSKALTSGTPLGSPLREPSSPMKDSLPAVNRDGSPSLTLSPPTRLEPLPPRHDPPENTTEQQEIAAFRGGYTLRKRNAAQLAPYTIERQQYRMTIRPCPEAEVNKGRPIRAPRDHTDRYEEEDDDEYQAPPEPHSPRRRTSQDDLRVQDAGHFPAMLQDLSDDDDPQIRASRRAAKEHMRKLRREQKEAERQARLQAQGTMPKQRFPLPTTSRPRDQQVLDLTMVEDEDGPRRHHTEPDPEFSHLSNYFGGDVDAAMDDVVPPSRPAPPVAPERKRKVRRRPRTPTPPPPDPNAELDPAELLRRHSPRKSRVLKHIVPKSMEKAFLLQGLADNKRKASKQKPPPARSDDDGPLMPGQTRTRRAEQPKDPWEIKGDTESEMEEPAFEPPSPVLRQASLFDFDKFELSHTKSDVEDLVRPRAPSPREIIEIPDDGDSSSGGEGEGGLGSSDEELIVIYRAEAAPCAARLPQEKTRESLIDYMTQRNRESNSRRKKRRTRRYQPRQEARPVQRAPSFKFDITTGGVRSYGKGNQTLLSFAKHTGGNGGSGRGLSSGTKTGSQHTPEIHEISSDSEPENDAVRKKKLKKRERERRKKMNGIYVFAAGNGNRITTRYTRVGQRPDQLQRILAPVASTTPGPSWTRTIPHPRQFRPFNETAARLDRPERVSDSARHPEFPELKPPGELPKVHEITSDLGVRPVASGRFFPNSTCIKRGLLHETIETIKGNFEPIQPAPVHVQSYDLSLDGGLPSFLATVGKMCEGLADAVDGLPNQDDEAEEAQWLTITHSAFRFLSWHLKHAQEEDQRYLREGIEERVSTLLRRLVDYKLDISTRFALIAVWFCVGFVVRLHPLEAGKAPHDLVLESTSFLIHNLLRIDFKSVEDLVKEEPPEGMTPHTALPAEMWLSLIHVLGAYPPVKRDDAHFFWTQLALVLKEDQPSQDSARASEYAWRLIFYLSALSHYSALGMTKAYPHLPSGWPVVVYALGTIRLKHLPSDRDVDQAVIRERDSYIHVVLTRCFHVREHWKWRMEGVTQLFKHLNEIFQSRQFGAFVHEPKDRYPSFLVQNDWSLLSIHTPDDSPFVLYLKLIAQAVADAPERAQNPNAPLPAFITKALASAVPLSPVTLSNPDSITEAEQAMFANRIIAAAVSVYLEPARYDRRLDQARSYLVFNPKNPKVCRTIIEAIHVWAGTLVHSGVSIRAFSPWIEEMAQKLNEEVNAYRAERRASVRTDTDPMARKAQNTILVVKSLFTAISWILRAFVANRTFPEPSIILAMKELCETWLFKGSQLLKNQVGLLMESAFKARALALPPPPRPPLDSTQPPPRPHAPVPEPEPVPETEPLPESQEFEGLDDWGDVDWDAPELQAALSAQALVVDPFADLELRFREAMTPFKTYPFRFASHYTNPPRLKGKGHSVDVCQADMWLNCWLGVRSLDNVELKPKVLFGLIRQNKGGSDQQRNWHLRLKVNLMLKLLRLEPKQYITWQALCVKRALQCLVSEYVLWEKDYFAFFLSLGGFQHPLFKDAAEHFPSRDRAGTEDAPANTEVGTPTGDFVYDTPEAFLEKRTKIVQAVLIKVDNALASPDGQDGLFDGYSKDQYVTWCIVLLKLMRRVLAEHASLPPGTRATAEYTQFCFEIATFFLQLRYAPREARLVFWKGWANALVTDKT